MHSSAGRLGRGAAFTAGLVAVLVSGCGSEEDGGDRERVAAVRSAVGDLQRAFGAGDVARVCTRMTAAAARQAGSAAHGDPRACEPDVRRFLGLIERGGGWTRGPRPRVVDVALAGDRAAVTLASGGRTARAFMREERGGWKLDGFFGSPPAVLDRRSRPVRARGATVVASDSSAGRRAGCFDVFDDGADASGGCELRVAGARLAVDVTTVFGSFTLADRCWISYRVLSDGQGRTQTVDVSIQGPSGTACGDIEPCLSDSSRPLPWHGRIVAGSGAPERYLHLVDACYRTCVGDFEGRSSAELRRAGAGWRVVSDRAAVGASGLSFRGRARVEARGFDLASAPLGDGSDG